MQKRFDLKIWMLIGFVIIAALSRLIPNMPNYSPMAAIALFGAAHFSKRWMALVVTLLATFLSDIVLNNTIYSYIFTEFTWFYDGFVWQYLAYTAIVFMGINLFSNVSMKKVVLGSGLATIIFFVLSNFGAWVSLPIYPKTVFGLLMAYTAGIAFLKATFLSDLVYSTLLFGGYYLLQNRISLFKLPHLKYA